MLGILLRDRKRNTWIRQETGASDIINAIRKAKHRWAGVDPGFFLGGGALVSCSTSTPINHIVFFFFAEYQLY